MKYIKYYIENNKVEFFNSILGVERVYINGQKSSEKFSVFGSNHNFEINDNSYKIRPFIDLLKLNGVGFKIYKNGELLDLENLISSKEKRKLIFQQSIGIIIAILFLFYLINNK